MLFLNAVPLPISIAAVVHCVYLIIFVTLAGRAPCFHGSFDYHLLFQLASAIIPVSLLNIYILLCTARAHPMNFVRIH